MAYNSQEDAISIALIILRLTEKITLLNLNVVNPNLRIEYLNAYCDSILGLSDVLIPFYDTVMDKSYEKFEKDLEKARSKNAENTVKAELRYISNVKKVHRILFRELNMLLKRNEYLKTAVYGESKDEVADLEDEGDSE